MQVHGGDTNLLLELRDTSLGAGDVRPLITSGIVVDPAGKSLFGVSLAVWASSNPFLNFQSDYNGHYRVRWLPLGSDIKPILVARAEQENLVATHELNQSITNLALHLQPASTLAGTVRDPDEKPITNATVALHMFLDDSGAELARDSVDTNGAFSFAALPRRGRYDLEISASNYRSSKTTITFSAPSRKETNVILQSEHP